MQYRNTKPGDECFYTAYKVRDWLITIFYPIVSMDTINMLLALKNCMNVCPGPQEPYNRYGHEPYKEGLYHIYVQYLVYLSNHVATD